MRIAGGGVIGRPAVRTLRPGLHLLETEVEDFDVRAAVVVGRERAAVFDTLAHPVQMEGVRALLGEGGGEGEPPRPLPLVVVYSHADWDHAWGTVGLAGAESVESTGGLAAMEPVESTGELAAVESVEAVVAQAHAAARFSDDVRAELRLRCAREPGVWDQVRLVPPTVTFQDSYRLDLGGVTLELHALPGHTPDCLVGFLPEWGMLLAGDTVETPVPFVNDGGAVAQWILGLERWLWDGRVEHVIPSHGRVGGPELIGSTVEYLRGLGAGGTPSGLDGMAPFYRETHARNVELVRGASPALP